MKLLTKEITEKAIRQQKANSDKTKELKDQKVVAKFFHVLSSWKWYLIELDEDKNYAFGIVAGNDVEIGPWTMQELYDIEIKHPLLNATYKMERDKFFKPINAQKCYDKVWKEHYHGSSV